MSVLRFILLSSIVSAAVLHAENTLFVMPTEITRGAMSDDAQCIALCLNNEEEPTALSFDIYLPDGVELDPLYDPIELNGERFPYTTGRGGVKNWEHTANVAYHEDGGFYRVIIFSQNLSKVSGTEGELLYLYYVSDADMPEGQLPVRISNITLALSGTEGVYPEPASSFVYTHGHSPAEAETLDLSTISATLPAAVCNAVNEQISQNMKMTEVRLDNLEGICEPLTAGNPNCLYYVKDGSGTATTMEQIHDENVVKIAEESALCPHLSLISDYPFRASIPFVASTATFTRENAANGWQAVYLPFSIPDWLMKGEVFDAVSSENHIANFNTSTIEAYQPYLVKVEDNNLSVTIENVDIYPEASVYYDNAGFVGVHTETIQTGDAYYTINPDGNTMERLQPDATLKPFHAWLVIPGAEEDTISVTHNNESTSLPMGIENSSERKLRTYDICGREIHVTTSPVTEGISISKGQVIIAK